MLRSVNEFGAISPAKSAFYDIACRVGNTLVGKRRVAGRPIFVTGNGRSGTTWLGETIGRAPGLLYYREPCHPNRNRVPMEMVDPIWSRYLVPGDRDPYFEDTIGGSFNGHIWRGSGLKASTFMRRLTARPRVLIKEVASFISLPWVADLWNPEVLIILRHPGAYAASVGALQQDTAELARLVLLREEPRLRAEHLSDVAEHVDAISDPLEAAVASWAIRTRVVLSARKSHPDWRLIFYEDLASRPVEEFRNLYQELGIEWGPEIEAWIVEHTQSNEPGTFTTTRKSSDQVWRWTQKLSSEEVARIRGVLEPFDLGIYDSLTDWSASPPSEPDIAPR